LLIQVESLCATTLLSIGGSPEYQRGGSQDRAGTV